MTDTAISKWEQAVNKLVEFTQDGKLEWQVVNPSEYLPKDDTSGAMLIVNYENKYLLLYRKAYIHYVPQGNMLFSTTDKEVKDYRAELSIYDKKSKVIIYTFPYSELINDLYKAATFNAAKVDELINNLLGDGNS